MRQISNFKFGCLYGNQGWAGAVENQIFALKIKSFKISERFKSLAQGVLEVFQEVYRGVGHNVPPPPPPVGVGLKNSYGFPNLAFHSVCQRLVRDVDLNSEKKITIHFWSCNFRFQK